MTIAEHLPPRAATEIKESGDNFMRCKEMQGHSSDEEQLPCVRWCLACGDLDCYRGSEKCKRIERKDMQISLMLGLRFHVGGSVV